MMRGMSDLRREQNKQPSEKSTSPSLLPERATPPLLVIEVPEKATPELLVLDSDSDVVNPEVSERPSTPTSPSLLDPPSTAVSPLKKALDDWSQEYAIPVVPQVPRNRTSRPNIRYYEEFYDMQQQKEILDQLLGYSYETITIVVCGRPFTPRRKVLAFADPRVSYCFSGISLQPKPWTPLMQNIKKKVEGEMGYEYNHALLNFYVDGVAKLSSHKDNEDCVDTSVPVLTLSFGAQRNMLFTKKGEKAVKQPLHPGSLLAMFDQKWSHGVIPDPRIKGPRVSISFRKLVVPPTVQVPWQTSPKKAYQWFVDMPMAQPDFYVTPESYPTPDSFEYAQHLTPANTCEPTTKKICLDPQASNMDVIPENDWLTSHCQGVAEPVDITAQNCVLPKHTDLRKFWLSDSVALSVQIYEGEMCVHIREYHGHTNDHFEMLPTKKGSVMNMFTFFDFCQKMSSFSKSLAHITESCILNNCVMIVIENCQMHIRQFNNAMLHPHEIVLSREMFTSLCDQIKDIVDYILDYQFNTLLKSQLCLPIGRLPYMEDSFGQLRNIVEYSVRDGIHFAFVCPECVSGQTDMYFHECRRLRYSEKYRKLPYYTPMMVSVKEIAQEYLSYNSKLSFNCYDFSKLYKNVY